MSTQWKKYLLWFAHEHVEFRVPEVESILNIYNITFRNAIKSKEHPFWVVELEGEEQARQIASRSVLLRRCIELWSHSTTLEGLHSNLKSYSPEEKSKHLGTTFKVIIETFCKHFTQKEKIAKIETFKYLPFSGSVKMNNPETTLYYIEYYGLEPNSVPDNPIDMFFGRLVAEGQRDLIQKLSLKSRKFIGNTSMDPQLSVIMANQAQIKNGDMVLDPFVGSGSLLIPASLFGGYTVGTDIDYLMIHGRTRPSRINQKKREKDEGVKANMKQYNVHSQFIDVVVSDFSRPLWRHDIKFDSIIADPPYGIRESVERIGTMKNNPVIEDHHIETHIPSKVVYDVSQLYKDLLTFASEHLKIFGLLVFWFPVFREQYSHDQLPFHPCFELMAASEQILSTYASRILLTFKKIKEPENDDAPSEIGASKFRDQYFNLREELRSVKRLRKSVERLQLKKDWENQLNGKIDKER